MYIYHSHNATRLVLSMTCLYPLLFLVNGFLLNITISLLFSYSYSELIANSKINGLLLSRFIKIIWNLPSLNLIQRTTEINQVLMNILVSNMILKVSTDPLRIMRVFSCWPCYGWYIHTVQINAQNRTI